MTRSPCPLLERGVTLRHQCDRCAADGTLDGTRRAPGEVLYRQGDPADALWALTEGLVRVSVSTADGRTYAARLVRRGALLGVEALAVGGQPHQATATVVRAARVCRVPIAEARAWLSRHPESATAIAGLTVEDLIEMQRRLVLNASLSAEERVLELVRDLARDTAPGAWTELPATREQLGEIVGLAFETVSRMLHRLAARGLIELDGRRVRIPLDPPNP